MHLDRMRKQSLARDVTVILALKAGALVVLYVLFFSPSHRPPANVHALFESATLQSSASR